MPGRYFPGFGYALGATEPALLAAPLTVRLATARGLVTRQLAR